MEQKSEVNYSANAPFDGIDDKWDEERKERVKMELAEIFKLTKEDGDQLDGVLKRYIA